MTSADMSERDRSREGGTQSRDTTSPTFSEAQLTERQVLDAAALRRRQLGTAFLHGSRRSWRRRHRVWPAASIGLLVVAIVVAAFSVASAFHRQQEINRENHTGRSVGTPANTPMSTPDLSVHW